MQSFEIISFDKFDKNMKFWKISHVGEKEEIPDNKIDSNPFSWIDPTKMFHQTWIWIFLKKKISTRSNIFGRKHFFGLPKQNA